MTPSAQAPPEKGPSFLPRERSGRGSAGSSYSLPPGGLGTYFQKVLELWGEEGDPLCLTPVSTSILLEPKSSLAE